MSKLYKYLLCILMSSSIALGNDNDLSQQTLIERFRFLVSHNPRLLKVAGFMGISTIILFLCYKLGHNPIPAKKLPKDTGNTPAELKKQQEMPILMDESQRPSTSGRYVPQVLDWGRG